MRSSSSQEPNLWERQPKESEQAWRAFLTYRDVIDHPRTVQKVADALSKSRQAMVKLKSRWFWDERVRAYENEIQRQALSDAVKERKKMNERHTRIAMQLQQAALAALDKLNTDNLSFKDIREAVKLGTELERVSRHETITDYREEVGPENPDEQDIVVVVPDNGRTRQIEDED